jgi:hypothetical protein
MAESNDQPWQQFRGSELGGMLSSIYGAPKPVINYPKFTKKKFEPTEAFSSSGAKVRESTKQNVKIAVPRVGNTRNERPAMAAVDCIARRKQESIIRAELEEIKLKETYYRPAHRQAIGDSEKERLNQICTYKGGKILPNDVAYPMSETPMEMAAKKKERERMDQLRDRRNPVRSSSVSGAKAAVLSDLEVRFRFRVGIRVKVRTRVRLSVRV